MAAAPESCGARDSSEPETEGAFDPEEAVRGRSQAAMADSHCPLDSLEAEAEAEAAAEAGQDPDPDADAAAAGVDQQRQKYVAVFCSFFNEFNMLNSICYTISTLIKKPGKFINFRFNLNIFRYPKIDLI